MCAKLNKSVPVQSAAEAELSRLVGLAWLSRVADLPPTGVRHDEALAALSAEREDDRPF